MRLPHPFRDLPVRYRLLLGYSVIFVVVIGLGSVMIFSLVRRTIEANIESELRNSTAATLNMVKAAVTLSIRNHLRAVAENNREIADYYYQQYKQGKVSEEDAKKQAAAILLSQKIGQTGYIYCLSSRGDIVVHREKALMNVNVADHPFAREQMSRKEGYVEYEWKNPGETVSRPKALYMTYFQPWDWIISASSYREEFKMLINTEDFRETVTSLKFGGTGYSFVIDTQGSLVIHPTLTGRNYFETSDASVRRFIQEMCRQKNGKITYSWKNPGETVPRTKLVIFSYLPELDWIVASCGYFEEIYAPLTAVRNAVLATVAASLILVLPLTMRISSSITNPLQELMQRFAAGTRGDFTVRADTNSRDELGQLASYFNAFMERLEDYDRSLRTQILDRKQAEQALRTSEEMFSKAFRSSPHGICITALKDSRLIDVNESLLHSTGYLSEELTGKTAAELRLFPNSREGSQLIDLLHKEGKVKNREIEFFRKDGNVRIGMVSAELIELGGEPAMLSVIEDVTESRRMEREIMDISDRERQRIGQDLHDDLGPHLIGIEVLSKILSQKLSSKGLEEAVYADRIRNLIVEAIDKTRGLSRGLCPVHLVAHGLETALKELAEKTFQIFRVSCVFKSDDVVLVHDNTVATHLFYIAQEAVHNAIRHGKAGQVLIELSSADGKISLTIRDDGCGIPETIPGKGMGLRIMGYRARLIGGALDISRDPEKGTIITCTLRNYEGNT